VDPGALPVVSASPQPVAADASVPITAPVAAASVLDGTSAGTPASAAPAPVNSTLAPPPVVDDSEAVRDVLQQYRSAYERLDADAAQAVWPRVDRGALARAFDGLQAQSVTFQSCDIQVAGDGRGSATCRGTTEYVPKVGGGAPRSEPRTWRFALRKVGPDWKIESARADR
jgi:hypothetical protein